MNKPDFETTKPMEIIPQHPDLCDLLNQSWESDPEPEEHFDPETGTLSGLDFITDIDCMCCEKNKLTYGEYIYVGLCSECGKKEYQELRL